MLPSQNIYNPYAAVDALPMYGGNCMPLVIPVVPYITNVTNALPFNMGLNFNYGNYNQASTYQESSQNSGFSTVSSNKSMLQRIVDTCKKYMGKGVAEMRQLMQSVGVKFHNRVWCADGGRFFIEQAFGGRENLPEWYKKCWYPSCGRVLDAAKKAGKVVPKSQAKPGMIALLDWNGDGKPQHFSIVEKIEGNTVYTLEANQTIKGKNGAYRRTRKLSQVCAFIDVTA